MLLNSFKAWIPIKCLLCSVALADQPSCLCMGCHDDLPWLKQHVLRGGLDIFCFYDYAWPIDRLIHEFKYHYELQNLDILCQAAKDIHTPQVDALVAIPISNQRLKERGFHQTLLLCEQLSQAWNIPIWQGLIRAKDTPRQQTLQRHDRLKNVQDAFIIPQNQLKKMPKKLLLVDDVMTTGATLWAAARALHETGQCAVSALAIAKTGANV